MTMRNWKTGLALTASGNLEIIIGRMNAIALTPTKMNVLGLRNVLRNPSLLSRKNGATSNARTVYAAIHHVAPPPIRLYPLSKSQMCNPTTIMKNNLIFASLTAPTAVVKPAPTAAPAAATGAAERVAGA